jgi:hypothetical protein
MEFGDIDAGFGFEPLMDQQQAQEQGQPPNQVSSLHLPQTLSRSLKKVHLTWSFGA